MLEKWLHVLYTHRNAIILSEPESFANTVQFEASEVRLGSKIETIHIFFYTPHYHLPSQIMLIPLKQYAIIYLNDNVFYF